MKKQEMIGFGQLSLPLKTFVVLGMITFVLIIVSVVISVVTAIA